MKISDFDIYHLPPLMGMFVDYIENECERLLQESPQFTELQREDHELLDEYPFLNMITDSNGVTKALDLNYAETEALARFCLVEDDINCWKRLQMYLLGIAYAMEIIELLKLDYQKHGACIGEETMLICYKQTEEKEDTEKERGDIMAENNTKELDFDRKHEEDLQRLRGLRLLDDDFMQKVFEDKACTEFLLQIILNRTDLKVLRVNGQQDIKNLQGRSVRLDILAVDAENRVYNIEIQRSDKGAGVKRARYNSSLIDANVTEPGEKYENLCESYVIFITENDIMKVGLPIYHIDRTVKETGELFGDESHIIYVNSQIKDESALGKLMHDFSCTDAKDMKYKILADRVRYFKEDEKGVAIMCKAMEDMRNEAAREAEKMKAIRMARLMIEDGKLNYEDIAMYTELTLEEVEKIALEKKSA